MSQKTCIIIAGPTAVGKTAAAIEVAKRFKTEIISADSRQCFRELNIGVAKPSPEQLKEIHHYFINSHSVKEEVSAAVFEEYALQAAETIFRKNNIAVMTGGTGLYIKSFCEGMDNIPDIPAAIRNVVSENYVSKGISWLQQEIKEKDPEYYASGEIKNPQRLMRALEVVTFTGKSIRSFQKGKTVQRNFNCIKIGLDLPREVLYENINRRVDIMMEEGLLKEAESLLSLSSLNALQTVGYKELFQYLNHAISLERAVDLIKKNTRHYAKRQLTWFHRDTSIKWFNPVDLDQIFNYLQKMV